MAILNHRFWDSRFARRPDIVGVMPEGFDFPMQETLWMPVSRTSEWLQRGPTPGGFMVVGRLKPNTSLEVARAELETINRRLEASYPATNRGVIPWVATYSQIVSGPDAPMIWASLWVGAWLVLLIACANLANLTLLRTIGRWREFSTRIALGAGQGRMIRQILTECLMLASVAGALAWWITNWSVRWWAAATASRYQVLDYTVGAGTLGYLVAITVTAALLLSLAPIGKVLQLGVIGALKGDSRGVTLGLRGKHLAEGQSQRRACHRDRVGWRYAHQL